MSSSTLTAVCDATNTHISMGDSTLFEDADEEDVNRTDTTDIRSCNTDAVLSADANSEEGQNIHNLHQPSTPSPLFAESSHSAISNDHPRWSKERNYSHGECDEIGATYVDERAPNLNLRFFRGLARRSRERRSSEHYSGNTEGDRSHLSSASASPFAASVRHMRSSLALLRNSGGTQTNHPRDSANQDSMNTEQSKELVMATLVEEEEPMEVAVAEKMSFFHLHWKGVVISVVVICCENHRLFFLVLL